MLMTIGKIDNIKAAELKERRTWETKEFKKSLFLSCYWRWLPQRFSPVWQCFY